MNVAKMTGVPDAIIEKVAAQAKAFEQTHKTHDSTYFTNLTPTILADIAYLWKPSDLNPRAVRTIVNSFRSADSIKGRCKRCHVFPLSKERASALSVMFSALILKENL
ncbi:hypothetical protein [Absidia glauca]|uniref:Uncharacterized protein n=1 Tax=Absidia glauca TaxID=4829 RepID=A0A163M8R0_ABSGL|nr:hypothetical protein [Absidia glauca]